MNMGAPPLLICRLHFWGSVKCLTGSHVGMIKALGVVHVRRENFVHVINVVNALFIFIF